MAKHPYLVGCTCARCTRELARRTAQGRQTTAVRGIYAALSGRRRRAPGTRRPVAGSQEWAETRGDDIDSYDVPGDDRD